MEGVVDLAEEIFHMPVNIGKPKSVAGLSDIVRNPIYATSVGLLQYGLGNDPQSHGAHRSERQVVQYGSQSKARICLDNNNLG